MGILNFPGNHLPRKDIPRKVAKKYTWYQTPPSVLVGEALYLMAFIFYVGWIHLQDFTQLLKGSDVHGFLLQIMRDPDTGNSRGFGFISYDSFEASDSAIEVCLMPQSSVWIIFRSIMWAQSFSFLLCIHHLRIIKWS